MTNEHSTLCPKSAGYTDCHCKQVTNEHERMVEEIVKKLCTDYYGREIQDEEELLRTTLSTLITKVREDERERLRELLPEKEECESGCGCQPHQSYHDGGSCVWQSREYYEAYELDQLFKALTPTNTDKQTEV